MIKRQKNKFRPRRALGSVVLTTATFLAFLGIVWQAYQTTVDEDRATKELPIISASNDPVKVKPEDEGGMEFPYRGMTIFETVEDPFAGEDRQQNRRIERLEFSKKKLFPTAEDQAFVEEINSFNAVSENFRVVPLSERQEMKKKAALDTLEKQKPTSQSKTGSKELPKILAVIEPTKVKQTDAPKTIAEPAQKQQAPVSEEKAIQQDQKDQLAATLKTILDKNADSETSIETAAGTTETKTTVTQTKTEKQPEKKTTLKLVTSEKKTRSNPVQTQGLTSGNYIIQLGSVRSADGAREEWGKIKSKLPGVLDQLNLNVERADLGDRGVFYRIQAGRIDKQTAAELCNKVKASKAAGCLVKKVN